MSGQWTRRMPIEILQRVSSLPTLVLVSSWQRTLRLRLTQDEELLHWSSNSHEHVFKHIPGTMMVRLLCRAVDNMAQRLPGSLFSSLVAPCGGGNFLCGQLIVNKSLFSPSLGVGVELLLFVREERWRSSHPKLLYLPTFLVHRLFNKYYFHTQSSFGKHITAHSIQPAHGWKDCFPTAAPLEAKQNNS